MCGIGGFYRTSEDKLSSDEIMLLLLNLQQRGIDATGVAWSNGKKICALKSPVKAEEFIESKDFQKVVNEIVSSKWALFHTRQATNGSAESNLNNHPIYNKVGLIIHNGIVNPVEGELPSKGQTDTEQILLYLQKYGWKGIEKLSGSLAIAYADFKLLDRFYLYSHLMPIVYSHRNGTFVFASTEFILRDSVDSINKVTLLPRDKVFRMRNGELTKIQEVSPQPMVVSKYLENVYQKYHYWF